MNCTRVYVVKIATRKFADAAKFVIKIRVKTGAVKIAKTPPVNVSPKLKTDLFLLYSFHPQNLTIIFNHLEKNTHKKYQIILFNYFLVSNLLASYFKCCKYSFYYSESS